MNILISTVVWGRRHFQNFVEYSLPSLLSRHNIPRAAENNNITLLLLTEESHIEEFKRMNIYRRSSSLVGYDFHTLEQHGFNPKNIPGSYDAKKYRFLSVCHNIIIALSKSYDVHVFNYADFIWSDGALSHILAAFEEEDIFGLLGFCIPVEEKRIKPILQSERSAQNSSIQISSYRAVDLALEHLHREALLRNWNGKHISHTPSYLYWEVPEEGILLRAFHHTLLAAAPLKASEIYAKGITHGTLDSSFSAAIAEHEKTRIAADSSKIFIFSMHDTFGTSRSHHANKKEILTSFISQYVSKTQLRNFKTPILIKRRHNSNMEIWSRYIESSLQDIGSVYEDNISNVRPCMNSVSVDMVWKNPRNPILTHRLLPMMTYYVKSFLKRLVA